ncbi:hypothetical protein V8E51_015875 [Hyaloscypha variabilis]
MSHLRFFLAVFLTFTTTTNTQGLLQARNPYYGGYALPGTPEDGAVHGCPSDTLTCSNEVFTFCCPDFTFCGPYQLGPYCCPTSDDCGSIVEAGNTCADPSWTLYEDAFLWCCAPGTVGLALGDGHCEPASLTYSSGEYANTVVQSNNAPPPTSWPGGTVPPGVSTVGAAPTSEGAAAKTTAAGATPTSTDSGAGSTSTSTPKSNVGATVGYNFALAIGGMVFAATLLVAVLL